CNLCLHSDCEGSSAGGRTPSSFIQHVKELRLLLNFVLLTSGHTPRQRANLAPLFHLFSNMSLYPLTTLSKKVIGSIPVII
ncbi:MAG TPA: hypothetical protein VMW01_13960, partial [Williamwhitmania sp.]|nr:hypothetical protein [Williamwhitmania sp.]